MEPGADADDGSGQLREPAELQQKQKQKKNLSRLRTSQEEDSIPAVILQ